MSTKLVPSPVATSMSWTQTGIGRSADVVAAFAPGDILDPTNAFAVTSASPVGSAFLSGATVYYRGGTGNSGSFQLRDTVADAGSGPASATFNTLTGTTTGWTHTTQSINTPAGGPFVSTNSYAWAAGTNSSPVAPVDGFDAVGNIGDRQLDLHDDELPRPDATFPSAPAYNTAGWTGSLTAPRGRSCAVKVSIQDTTVGGSSCWNGTTFTAACPNYVAATGTRAGATHSPPAQ